MVAWWAEWHAIDMVQAGLKPAPTGEMLCGTEFTPIPTSPPQGGRGLRAGKGMGPRIREDKVGMEHWLNGGGCRW